MLSKFTAQLELAVLTVPVDPQPAASRKAKPSVLPSPVLSIGMLHRGEPPPTQAVFVSEGSQSYWNENVTPPSDVPETCFELVMNAPAKPPDEVSSVTVFWLTEQVAGAPLKHFSFAGGAATATAATTASARVIETMCGLLIGIVLLSP